MKTAIAFALAAGKLAAAHATFQSIVLDGKDQGGKAVQTPSNGNNPILDVTSKSMICNGGTKAADTLEVAAGSQLGLQWHHNQGPNPSDSDEPIAPSHKGPVMVYIAPAESNGEGDVWVKLQEDGFSGGKWGVDNFIANKGLINVKLPNLAAGDYLIRPELIGLHEASAEGKAQFYNGCGQIKVTGSGSVSLPSGVDMTKAYSATDPGVKCNIYGDVKCTKSGSAGYDVPGPAVWDGASGGSGSGSGSAPASSAPASSAAPTATAAASSAPASSAPAATPAPTMGSGYDTPSATQPAAQPTPTAAENNQGSGSGSTLPETFTISEFIKWLETKTGSATAKRFARAFAGRAHARDFA